MIRFIMKNSAETTHVARGIEAISSIVKRRR